MRDAFALPQSPYFLSHSVGCLPKVSKLALEQLYFEPWQQQGGDAWPAWLQSVDGFRQQLAQLLGGQPEQYCPQSNLSSGLTKWLCAIAGDAKRNQVLMHESAFPSMGFVVDALQKLGLELVLVKGHHSENDPDTWRRYLSSRTLCVLLTHVHSNTGVLTNVAPLAAMCKDHGCYCVVDIAQSVGIVPIDIGQWQVDAVFGSCVKWLCGGPGAGFMWVNPSVTSQLEPIDVGWFSHQNPFEMDIRHFQYADNAQRFWGGTPSVASYIVAGKSIELINQIGVEQIWQHNRRLASELLLALPSQLSDQIDLLHSGGTLCLQSDMSTIERAKLRMTDAKIHFDQRNQTIRLSLHIYNHEDELNVIVDAFN